MRRQQVSVVLVLLEVILQSLLFLSISSSLMIIAADVPVSQMYRPAAIIIPVILFYFLRKTNINLYLFDVIHIVFIGFFWIVGENDAQKIFMSLAMIVLVAYSIRLKNINYDKMASTNVPLQESLYNESKSLRDDGSRRKIAVAASERVPVVMVLIIVVGFIFSQYSGKTQLMYIQLAISIAYILLQFLYNNMKKIYDIFMINGYKKDFPARQMINVNTFIVSATMGLMVLSMIIFYGGDYGGIFSVLGKIIVFGGSILIRLFIGFLLFIAGLQKTYDVDDVVQNVEEEMDIEKGLTEIGNHSSQAAQILFQVVAVAMVIGIVIAMIIYCKKYADKFKKAAVVETDTLEFISKKDRDYQTDKNIYSVEEISESSKNKTARKLYKQAVKKRKGRKIVDTSFTPENITKIYLKEGEDVTAVYEKARYSNEEIAQNELDILKKL